MLCKQQFHLRLRLGQRPLDNIWLVMLCRMLVSHRQRRWLTMAQMHLWTLLMMVLRRRRCPWRE